MILFLLPIYLYILTNFKKLDCDAIIDIEKRLSDEEIRHVAFSMGPFKAPGIDGLHIVFFQSQWEIIGKAVCKFIRDAFEDPSIIKNVNQTLLVLIPKVENPESLKDMCPISLCNVIYKMITRIIANRIKPYLPELIAPNQSSFVPGRHSNDNIIVAQEVLDSMKLKKGTRGLMAIKIDLEKAYDRLS